MFAEHRLSLVRRRTNWDVILRKLDVDGDLQPVVDEDDAAEEFREKGEKAGKGEESGNGALDVREIDTHTLFNLMASPRDSQTLILDVRPREEFDEFHIFGAVHVDWERYHPRYDKALFRSNDWIIPSLESSYIRPHTLPLLGRFQQRRFSNVVVYASADCSNCRRLLDSFLHFLREQRLVDAKKLFVLKGGIEAFLDKKPSLVIATPSCESGPLVSISAIHPETMTLPYTRTRFVLPSEIIQDALYLGGKESADSIDVIKALKITHVLNMSAAATNPFEHLVKYLNIPAGDSFSFPLDDRFQPILEFIYEAIGDQSHFSPVFDQSAPSSSQTSSSSSFCSSSTTGRVLVHCDDGISASAAAVLLFLLDSRRLSLRRAYSLTRRKRPTIKPNVNFLIRLAQFEKEKSGRSTIFFPVTEAHLLTPLTPFFWRDAKGNVEERPPYRRQKTWMDREIESTSDLDIVSLKSRSPDARTVMTGSRAMTRGPSNSKRSTNERPTNERPTNDRPMPDRSTKERPISERPTTDGSTTRESIETIDLGSKKISSNASSVKGTDAWIL